MKFLYALSIFLCFFAGTLQAQESNAPKFGKGLFNLVGQDSSWTMKVGLRFQLLSSSIFSEDHQPEHNFLVRRSRLKFDGYAFSPKLRYKFELGLSNRDMSGTSQFTRNSPRFIMDAVVMWNFYENFELWVGQTKLPGNRERVISSANLETVDRSLLNGEFNIDRDIGLQLHHETNWFGNFITREIVAVSQGEGRNVTSGNEGGHQFTGRVEFLPLGNFKSKGDYTGADLERHENPRLSIGVTYDYNNNAVRERSNLGTYMETDTGFHETDISTFFIDAHLKYRGFSFLGEYADRNADDPIAKNSDGTLTGDIVEVGNALNLQAGILNKSNWQFLGRYTHMELDKEITGRNPVEQYTIGISKYFVGHKLKIQSDISMLDAQTDSNEYMFRLQFELHF
ncbi:porin [Aegicerativicinus sediminis]|uniref:porin n=1 Tax=Aegicerativicinus sediminis TaxID=2893202 RepID=UPI001E2C64B1|nr:porin [Aegicerativicinus sediminis]